MPKKRWRLDLSLGVGYARMFSTVSGLGLMPLAVTLWARKSSSVTPNSHLSRFTTRPLASKMEKS